MENTQQAQRPQDKTGKGPLLIFLLLLQATSGWSHPKNPHAPKSEKWEIRKTGTEIAIATHIRPPGDATVQLQVDLCKLDIPFQMPPTTARGGRLGVRINCQTLANQKGLWGTQFYACPTNRPPHCKGQGEYFCASWGCETAASWKNHDRDILISLTSNKSCTV